MKHLLLVIFTCLFCLNTAFSQDLRRHSLAFNYSGIYQAPRYQSDILTFRSFHIARHLGGTYRLQLTSKHSLRLNVDYKDMKVALDSWWSPFVTENMDYIEYQTGLGYEFIIKEGKIEPYIGIDIIVISSETIDYYADKNTGEPTSNRNKTNTRNGYGGSILFGLRYNIFDKFSIGLESNIRYLRNRELRNIVTYNHAKYIDVISYSNFSELNPLSAIVIKYNI